MGASDVLSSWVAEINRHILWHVVSLSGSAKRSLGSLRTRAAQGMKRKAVNTWAPEVDRLSVEAVTKLLPGTNYRLHRDDFNGRYQVLYRGNRCSWSRSWGGRGRRQCLLELLRLSWKHHMALTGEPCPIVRLFEEK